MGTMQAGTGQGEAIGIGWSRYRIVVEGIVPGRFSQRMAGMRITTTSQWNRTDASILDAPFRDQSELFKIMNSLHEMQLPIIALERLASESSGKIRPPVQA